MVLGIMPSYQTTAHYAEDTRFTNIKIKLKNSNSFLHDLKLTSDSWHLPELQTILLITLIVKLSYNGFLNVAACTHVVKYCLTQTSVEKSLNMLLDITVSSKYSK